MKTQILAVAATASPIGGGNGAWRAADQRLGRQQPLLSAFGIRYCMEWLTSLGKRR